MNGTFIHLGWMKVPFITSLGGARDFRRDAQAGESGDSLMRPMSLPRTTVDALRRAVGANR